MLAAEYGSGGFSTGCVLARLDACAGGEQRAGRSAQQQLLGGVRKAAGCGMVGSSTGGGPRCCGGAS